jgi:aspartate beta-hydroxylase
VAPWVGALEAATPAIAAEYEAIRAAGLPSDYEAEASDHGTALHTGESEWHWASLIDRGRARPHLQARCPSTMEALNVVPGLCVGDMPFAFAFFSTLRPRCKIAPHTSPANLRLRVHLPLVVPEPDNCGITVAGETRRWEVGKALIFDDAYEHSVWNEGSQERVLLLFDLWHWELAAEEIESIEAMFRSVEEKRDARSRSNKA